MDLDNVDATVPTDPINANLGTSIGPQFHHAHEEDSPLTHDAGILTALRDDLNILDRNEENLEAHYQKLASAMELKRIVKSREELVDRGALKFHCSRSQHR